MDSAKILVYCECCGKEIEETKANCLYIKNNYIIMCSECYNKERGVSCQIG